MGDALMNGHSASTPSPTPGPFCAVYAPLLPLLDAQALTSEEEASLREHLADCAWCQKQLAAYGVVDDALRRQYAALLSVQPLKLEDILRASQSERQFSREQATRANTGRALRAANPPDLPEAPTSSRGVARREEHGQQRSRPWATLGAVAATLLIVVLAAALFTSLRLRTPGGASAANCASMLQETTPAALGPNFSAVTFPTGAVMTIPRPSFGGPSQFTLYESVICYSGTADDLTGSVSGHPSVTANLLGSGWSASPSFPYQGALLQPCPSHCYQLANTRYLALEQITDHGNSVYSYHLRLAAPPPAPTCNANFANSPLQGVQTAVEDTPLPPITYVVPDNAAHLRGYDLCSSGTVASVSAFLSSALPASGWTKVAANARCFYADQCWTKASAVISWQIDDPTDWHIAYRPATS
jgi:hypothetical protein